MDKGIKVFKHELRTSIRDIGIYYGIFITVCILSVIFRFSGDGQYGSWSGIEFASVVFIFVAGLNSFKPTFYFTQANSISRKDMFKGIMLFGVAISIGMAVLDVIINRIFNIITQIPMNFDMIYGTARGIEIWNNSNFVVNNSIGWIVSTCIWTMFVYMFVFMIGYLLTIAFFRLNKLGKTILGCLMGGAFILIGSIAEKLPSAILVILEAAFGWNSRNPYIALITFGVLIVVLGVGQFMLIRKAMPNRILE